MRLWSVLPFLIFLDLSWSLFYLPVWSFLILQMLTLCGRPSSTPTRCSACNVQQCALETTAWSPKGPWNPLNLNHLNTFLNTFALGTSWNSTTWYILVYNANLCLYCFVLLLDFLHYIGAGLAKASSICATSMLQLWTMLHVDFM